MDLEQFDPFAISRITKFFLLLWPPLSITTNLRRPPRSTSSCSCVLGIGRKKILPLSPYIYAWAFANLIVRRKLQVPELIFFSQKLCPSRKYPSSPHHLATVPWQEFLPLPPTIVHHRGGFSSHKSKHSRLHRSPCARV